MTDPPPSEFETKRSELVGVIGDSLEKVLQQLNTLNRNLEGIIAIGNEFSAVEALWSQFESVMDSTDDVNVESGGNAKEGEAGIKEDGKQEDQNLDPESARKQVEAETRNGNAT